MVAALLGIGGLGLFARRQTRLAEPLIDMRLFRRREYAGSVSAALVAMFVTAALSLMFAQYFQLVLGWSQLSSALAGLPGAAAAVVGGVAAAPALARWGHGRVVPVGLALTGLGCALCLPVDTTANYPVVLVAMLVFGTGAGLSVAVTNHTVVEALPPGRAGAAAAISETAFEVGGALGIALIGSVLNAVYRARLVLPSGLTGEQAGRLRESIGGALTDAPAMPAESARAVAAARQAFVDGIHVATVACAMVAVLLAGVTSSAMRAGTDGPAAHRPAHRPKRSSSRPGAEQTRRS
ncbi:MFS transporter [Kitasatospora sp. MAP5-34]|uniref:MFS transporter n=1 Tax=Kitasatospora sp. MAP5-34 TaxID=3035102 RepID=UPI002475CB84|nr:MFS transporter [Kitasatospora sp. MAP5-34]MDH6579327.1 MFS family permease [Kitasatospora sp. MAP5-34]